MTWWILCEHCSKSFTITQHLIIGQRWTGPQKLPIKTSKRFTKHDFDLWGLAWKVAICRARMQDFNPHINKCNPVFFSLQDGLASWSRIPILVSLDRGWDRRSKWVRARYGQLYPKRKCWKLSVMDSVTKGGWLGFIIRKLRQENSTKVIWCWKRCYHLRRIYATILILTMRVLISSVKCCLVGFWFYHKWTGMSVMSLLFLTL